MNFEQWYWSVQTEDESNKPEYEWARYAWEACQQQQAQTIAEMQAKIDRLMFEYCADEMTEAQISIFEQHQESIK